jgi:hypothetical protein
MEQMNDHARDYITRFCGYIEVDGRDLVVKMPFTDEEAALRAMNNALQKSTC